MNIKKTVMAVAAAALGMTAVTANASALDGMYVGGGLALNKMSLKLSGDGAMANLGDDKHDAALNLFAGYGASFGQFYLAGELGYQTSYGKADFGSIDGETVTGKLKNGWTASVLPGFKLGKSTLAFARLGYAQSKGELTFAGESSGSEKFKGTIYGIGVKHAFTPNLAGVLEYQSVNLKKTFEDAKVEPSSNGVVLGIQYGF
ncbi:MAG: outer membrane beta-barrel protein [Thiobacillus sp.]|nr:outer membrane beta-barrel protein [Thiobacillus sp.]